MFLYLLNYLLLLLLLLQRRQRQNLLPWHALVWHH
jgi:hypothetical protein